LPTKCSELTKRAKLVDLDGERPSCIFLQNLLMLTQHAKNNTVVRIGDTLS